jgi:hypothetical protein
LDVAVVEVDLIVLIHQAHVVALHVVRGPQDEVYVVLVLQDDIVENLEGGLAEINGVIAGGDDFLTLRLGNGLGDATGQAHGRLDGFTGDGADDLPEALAHLDDLAAGLDAGFGDDAQDVALRGRGAGPHHEVRAAQEEEVQDVIFRREGVIHKLPDEFGGARRLNIEDAVNGLGGGHVVRRRADAADHLGDAGHFLGGASLGEFLKAA